MLIQSYGGKTFGGRLNPPPKILKLFPVVVVAIAGSVI